LDAVRDTFASFEIDARLDSFLDEVESVGAAR